MKKLRSFASWLAPYFDRFVALKRASGVTYDTSIRFLLVFDRYVAEHAPEPPLRQEDMTRYLESIKHLSPRSRDNIIAVVWPATTYARLHGANIENLIAKPKMHTGWRQRQPRILSKTEIEVLLRASRHMRSTTLCTERTATLMGLMYTTGIRIGEALALDVRDLDRHNLLLTIRSGKFDKSRALILRQSTMDALTRHLEHPARPTSTEPTDPFFVSGRRQRLSCHTVRSNIRHACLVAGISEPWPRPHDFRHTFSVNCVATWYAQKRDVNLLLPALSAYLGHVSIENTRKYLVANGILLGHAASLFEQHTKRIDEVLS